MTQIYLIRHAEAEGNLYRRVQGQYDALVTQRGFLQIAALEKRFRDIHIDAVYSSDLYRTMATARAIYPSHGLPLHTDPGLREVNVGEWEDLPWGLLSEEYTQELWYFDNNDPTWHVENSETFEGLRDRLTGTLAKIAAAHEGQTVAVFSHGMAIRNALAKLLGYSVQDGKKVPHCDNTGVTLLQYENGVATVVYMNDNSHLSEELSTFAGQKWWQDEEGALADANLWYRPLDMEREAGFFLRCRQEAWESVYGDLEGFDADGFLCDVTARCKADPRTLWQVMLRQEPVGLLQLDLPPAAGERYGAVPFLYLLPQFRGMGLGVQLIGQAVSVFRHMGRDYLRLKCWPGNEIAQKFYEKYGFVKIGETMGSHGTLDILEKYIGFEQ